MLGRMKRWSWKKKILIGVLAPIVGVLAVALFPIVFFGRVGKAAWTVAEDWADKVGDV